MKRLEIFYYFSVVIRVKFLSHNRIDFVEFLVEIVWIEILRIRDEMGFVTFQGISVGSVDGSIGCRC
jgi:hypothetical protein